MQQAANCSVPSRSVLYPRKLAIRKLTWLALYRFVYTRLERWRAKVVSVDEERSRNSRGRGINCHATNCQSSPLHIYIARLLMIKFESLYRISSSVLDVHEEEEISRGCKRLIFTLVIRDLKLKEVESFRSTKLSISKSRLERIKFEKFPKFYPQLITRLLLLSGISDTTNSSWNYFSLNNLNAVQRIENQPFYKITNYRKNYRQNSPHPNFQLRYLKLGIQKHETVLQS